MKRKVIAVLSLSVFGVNLALLSGCAAPESTASPAAAATPPAKPDAPVLANPGATRTTSNGLSGLDMTSGNAAPSPAATPAAAMPGNARGTAQPAAATPAAPTYPAGANFTIFCQEISSPDHVTAANELKKVLMANTPLKDWYIVHEEGRSILYHGYYRQIAGSLPQDASAADRADADRAKRDKEQLEKIPNPRALDRKLFGQSIFVPLNSPDPTAPPEWNLANAKGFWSVQVAAFTTPDRKQQAVEAVKEARAMGIDAYYYHGSDGISQVCIGSWPEQAVKLPSYAADPGKQGVDRGTDPDRDVLLDLGAKELSPDELKQLGRNGNGMRVMQPKAEIVDPSMRKVLEQYPVHAVDGMDQIVQDTGEPRPSFIVYVPGHSPQDLSARSANGLDDASVRPADVAARRAATINRLRGIGR